MRYGTASRLLLVVVGMALVHTRTEGASCDSSAAAQRFPSAKRAISAWEASNKTRLLEPAKERLLIDFCDAAVATAADPKNTPEKLESASEAAVKDYLDRELDASSTPRTIAAALRSALGASGFSRPALRKLGTVDIKGNGERIKLSAEESESKRTTREEHAAPVVLLLAPGKITVEPLTKDKACSWEGPVVVQAGATVVIRCVKP
ncbi:hypothetical protein [Aquabacterium sp.]|uniref:hypothetical protein n=1 Tax=Aquabacterium sp. TaxID=1872578 RepID=UPI002C09BC21|nr:hypothetical protein [Aquabacterium sp.]HSW07308.1 hypothetical protein [Aquabacterium sp.]